MTQIVVDRVEGIRPAGASVAPVSRSAGARRNDHSVPRPLRRPARGSARTTKPALRPVSFCPSPALTARSTVPVRACVLPAPEPEVSLAPTGATPTWRLTDRGVAVVLVVGLMIMVAALTVVGLTAVKVTGEGNQATVSASMPR